MDPVSRAVRAPGGFLLPFFLVGEIPYAASGERERAIAAAAATLDLLARRLDHPFQCKDMIEACKELQPLD